MRDIAFLTETLPLRDQPGLDSLDPRFAHITALAEKGLYDQAADEIAPLLRDHVYDVRLITIYLFQVFQESGLVGAGAIVEGLARILEQSWAALGPAKNREKYVEKSLTWLFSRMADVIVYHDKKRDERIRAWRAAVDPVALDAALDAGTSLVARLVPPTYPHAGEALGRVLRELRAGREVALSQLPPPAPVPTDERPKQPVARESKKQTDALRAHRERIELEVSSQFIDLCLKLRAFETLIDRHDFEKAALVSDDLRVLIETFDPRAYLPELFASFSALVSEHVSALAPFWDRRESLEYKALQQFYQVDLDQFVGD